MSNVSFKLPALILMALLASSCSRNVDKSSRISFTLPTADSVRISSAVSTLAACNPGSWGKCDALNVNEFNCYAVLVETPEGSGRVCKKLDQTVLIRPSVLGGLYASGDTVSLPVESGSNRRIALVGFVASSPEDCRAMSAAGTLNRALLSAPMILDDQTIELSPGDKPLTMTRKIDPAKKIDDCAWPTLASTATANANFAAASLSFSTTAGSVNVQSIAVTNTGNSKAYSFGMDVAGSLFAFYGGGYPGTGGTCGEVLNIGATCTVMLKYSPVAVGTHTGTVQLNFHDGNSMVAKTLALSGTASAAPAAVLAASPSTFDYGTVTTGADADLQITITNTGNATAISMNSTMSGEFTFAGGAYPGTGGTCAGTLAGGGATCSLRVRFTPASAGAKSATMSLNYNNGSGTTSVTASLTGTGSLSATLVASPSPTTFGIQMLSTFRDETITITNSGASSATNLSSTRTGEFEYVGGTYPGSAGTCGTTLASSANCTLKVRFTPSTPGARSATLTLNYDGPASQSLSVPLAGTGAPIPAVAITSPAANSGSQTSITVSGTCSENGRSVNLSGGATGTTTCGGGAWSATLDTSALGDGTFMISANHSDVNGFTAPQSDRLFIKDTVGPTLNNFAIEAGAAVTNMNPVLLAIDANGAAEMRVGDTCGGGSWETYATSKSWSVPGGDGVKTIYVKFRDANGAESSCFSDTINYDSAAPVASIGGVPTGTNTQSTLSVGVGGTDVTHYKWKLSSTNDCSTASGYSAELPESTDITGTIPGDGVWYLCVVGRDAAMNWQPYPSATYATWTRDTIAPNPFNITGITGGSDVTADMSLVGTVYATVNWEDTLGENSYDLLITDESYTNVCAPANVPANTTSYTFSGCALSYGSFYRVSVIAKDDVNYTPANNDTSVFVVRLIPPVVATYPSNGLKWNDYVSNTNTANPAYRQPGGPCTGIGNSHNDCINGGLFRMAQLNPIVNCAGFSAVDSELALRWVCDASTGTAVFYSTGFNPGKGLRDLLNTTPAWKNMTLSIYRGARLVFQSLPQPWWSNPVQLLPPGGPYTFQVADNSKVYVAGGNVQSFGYHINGQKISIVTLAGGQINFDSSSTVNCNNTTGESGTMAKCAITAGAQDYSWIEASINANGTAQYGILIGSGTYNTIHNTSVSNSATGGYTLAFLSSNGNQVDGFTSSGGAGGVHLEASAHNVFQDIRLFNHQGAGLEVTNSSSGNRFVGVMAANGAGGIYVGPSPASANTFSHITAVNLTGKGIEINNTTSTAVAQYLGVNNAVGMYFNGGTQASFVHTVATFNNDYDLKNSSATNITFFGKLRVTSSGTSCNQMSGSGVSISASCSNSGGIPGMTMTQGLSASGLFEGKLDVADLANLSSNATGSGTMTASTDVLNFDNPFRGWGVYNASYNIPNVGVRSYCASGNCQIWDFRPAMLDVAARDVNGYFTDQNICPAAADGSLLANVMTDQQTPQNVFLVNAREIPGDGIGDDDGLCETGEACVFSPNIGAYQGTGSPYSKTCNFIGSGSTGFVDNVTMYGYGRYSSFDGGSYTGFTIANQGFDVFNPVSMTNGGRVSLPKTSGKWYFEVQLIGSNLAGWRVGLGDATHSVSVPLGSETGYYGIGMDLTGTNQKIWELNNEVTTMGYPAFISGGVVGVAVDMDTYRVYFRGPNGEWKGGGEPGDGAVGSPMPGGPKFPMVTGNNGPINVRLNTGQKAFKFKVPAGFHPGWYD